jgi:hypothetical protein
VSRSDFAIDYEKDYEEICLEVTVFSCQKKTEGGAFDFRYNQLPFNGSAIICST